jgi:uracil-DNA glycosylase
MTPEQRHQALVELGRRLDGRDLEAYASFGKDPDEPVIGGGDPLARIAMVGRDPGRDEIRHGLPFVGAGGQKVRAGLHRALFGGPPPNFEASIEAGQYVFWANMVPYKPLGNKAWPPAVVRAFAGPMGDLLATGWQGTEVITLGDGAFKWFAHLGAPDTRALLDAHWASPDRFETSVAILLGGRAVRLHPLPHPSPLNATWTTRFPGLLDARLRALGLNKDHWRRVG